MSTWEARMSQRAQQRREKRGEHEYGALGDPLPDEWCRECWGDRYVWLGGWGLRHVGGTMSGCQHSCHEDEVWLAASS
jgi:hypothetical protein